MLPSIRLPSGGRFRSPSGCPRDPIRVLRQGCCRSGCCSIPCRPVAGLQRGCWQLQQCPATSVQVAVAVRRRGGPVTTLRRSWPLQRPAPSIASRQTSFGTSTRRQHPATAAEVRFLRGARGQHPEVQQLQHPHRVEPRVQQLQRPVHAPHRLEPRVQQLPRPAAVHRVEPRLQQLQRPTRACFRSRVNGAVRCLGSVFA